MRIEPDPVAYKNEALAQRYTKSGPRKKFFPPATSLATIVCYNNWVQNAYFGFSDIATQS